MSEITVTLWPNVNDADGSAWTTNSWENIFKRLESPIPYRGEKDHPGWSAGRFEPCHRNKQNVRQMFAVVFDYDNKITETIGGKKVSRRVDHPVTMDAICEAWGDAFGLVHTSRSHRPEWPRFRVVLVLSRPVSAFEYAELWARLEERAGHVDVQTKDCSRLWYLPAKVDGGEFLSKRLSGVPLNVDGILARPVAQKRVSEPYKPSTGQHHDPSAVEKRALAYLKTIDGAVSGSGGHTQTLRAAVSLARGFDLDEETTFQILWSEYNQRCSPPWSERELWHKAKQARHKSTRPFGYLLVDRQPERFEASRELQEDVERIQRETVAEANPSDVDVEREAIQSEEPGPKPAVQRYPVSTLRAMLVEVFEDAKDKTKQKGFTTGIQQLDAMLGGYRPGNVTLLAAQTSWGKSSYAVMAQDENYERGAKVLVISREDKRLMYGRRIACRRGNLNALRVRDRDLDPKELAKLGQMATEARDDYMFLDALGMNAESVSQAIVELCAEVGFQFVICDYIQRFRAAKQTHNRRDEVTYVAEILSDAIKRANAAGLLLSQCKRTEGREPTMDDVKESGDLENMAEHVMIGWRELLGTDPTTGAEEVKRHINIPKNKDGPVRTSWIEMPFDEVTASFRSDVEGSRRRPLVAPPNPIVDQFDDFAADPLDF